MSHQELRECRRKFLCESLQLIMLLHAEIQKLREISMERAIDYGIDLNDLETKWKCVAQDQTDWIKKMNELQKIVSDSYRRYVTKSLSSHLDIFFNQKQRKVLKDMIKEQLESMNSSQSILPVETILWVTFIKEEEAAVKEFDKAFNSNIECVERESDLDEVSERMIVEMKEQLENTMLKDSNLKIKHVKKVDVKVSD